MFLPTLRVGFALLLFTLLPIAVQAADTDLDLEEEELSSMSPEYLLPSLQSDFKPRAATTIGTMGVSLSTLGLGLAAVGGPNQTGPMIWGSLMAVGGTPMALGGATRARTLLVREGYRVSNAPAIVGWVGFATYGVMSITFLEMPDSTAVVLVGMSGLLVAQSAAIVQLVINNRATSQRRRTSRRVSNKRGYRKASLVIAPTFLEDGAGGTISMAW
jgi:hypothetical protein